MGIWSRWISLGELEMAEKGGPLQAADDMIRIITNGLTLGLADKGISQLTGQDEAALTAAARERAGIAGDAASILGAGGAVKGLWTGGKAAVKVVPKIAKAAVSKKGGLAALLGIGTLAEHNSRTSGGQARAAAPASPKTAAKPAARPRSTAGADRVADGMMAALRAVDASPPTFASMAQRVAAEQGGLSLNQLGALAEVSQRTAPKPVKAANPAYETAQRLQSYYAGLREAEIASGVPQAQADANWAAKMEGLMKLSATDQLIRDSSMPSYDDED